MKETFVLAGPIAAGKSYIGHLIEEYFNVPFLEYEDIFVREHQRDITGYLERAEPKAEKRIFDFFDEHKTISFENTMERNYAISILNKLQNKADVRIIYVDAPFEVTLQRLEMRDSSSHLNWSRTDLKRIYGSCAELDFDIKIDNTNLSEEDIISQLRPLMEERKWYDDHVEIMFKGKKLKFSSWSNQNLTDYDMKYKPWSVSFKKENPGYLRNYTLKPGDVVVDAGAYEGTFSIYAATEVGERGTVIAFEPDSENFRKLEENIKLNHLDNVIAINKALWSSDKVLKFNNKHTAGASFFFNKSPYEKEIEAVSLDNELRRLGVENVDFIKMDVEGSEMHVLNGCKTTLGINDTNLAIATYHIVNGEETSDKVEEILKKYGYNVETGFTDHKTTYGSKIGSDKNAM